MASLDEALSRSLCAGGRVNGPDAAPMSFLGETVSQ